MAETFTVDGSSDGVSWDISIGSGDYVGFAGAGSALAPISQDSWQTYTTKTDASLSTNNGSLQNNQYVSSTTISVNGAAAVTLNHTNVAQTETTLRLGYTDSAGATILSNMRFFAYQSAPATAPTDVTVVAFEHRGTSVGIDTDSGVGRAWNASYGIGGSANALILADQGSASQHYAYVGISAKPTSRGIKTFTLRWEFDVT